MKRFFLMGICILIMVNINPILAQVNYQCCIANPTNIKCQLLKIEESIYFGSPNNSTWWNNYYSLNDYINGKTRFDNQFQYQTGKDPQGNITHKKLANSETFVKIAGIDSMIRVLQTQQKPLSSLYHYGVRMHFGMENESMIILFEPVIFSETDQQHLKKTTYLSHTYFKFDKNGNFITFSSPLQGVLTQYEKDYQDPTSKIYIIHDGENSDKYNFCYDGDDSKMEDNDIKFVLMPIQQIIRLYLDNGGDCVKNDEQIKFSYVIDNKRANNNEDYQSKPHIVASYKIFTSLENLKNTIITNKTYSENSFTNLGADYTEQCPNNCNEY